MHDLVCNSRCLVVFCLMGVRAGKHKSGGQRTQQRFGLLSINHLVFGLLSSRRARMTHEHLAVVCEERQNLRQACFAFSRGGYPTCDVEVASSSIRLGFSCGSL